jgi:hypothetical protein
MYPLPLSPAARSPVPPPALSPARPLPPLWQSPAGDVAQFEVSGTTYSPEGVVTDETGGVVPAPSAHPALRDAAMCRCDRNGRAERGETGS